MSITFVQHDSTQHSLFHPEWPLGHAVSKHGQKDAGEAVGGRPITSSPLCHIQQCVQQMQSALVR